MPADTSGKTKATYRYNARGALVYSSGTDNIHEINPLRYRGYYYDSETGFYYLQSRYYDPAICRFINTDSYASTGQGFIGMNMFAYCNNSPIAYTDSSGHTLSPAVTICNFGSEGKKDCWIREAMWISESYNKITITAYLTISGPIDPDIISIGNAVSILGGV